jgi:hypothetical protein
MDRLTVTVCQTFVSHIGRLLLEVLTSRMESEAAFVRAKR